MWKGLQRFRAGFLGRLQINVQSLPRTPVDHTYSILPPNFLLLWAKVAHYYGSLGFLGRVRSLPLTLRV